MTAEPPPDEPPRTPGALERRLAAVEELLDEILARLDAGEPLPPPAGDRPVDGD